MLNSCPDFNRFTVIGGEKILAQIKTLPMQKEDLYPRFGEAIRPIYGLVS